MQPIISPRLLTPQFAATAVNTWVLNGELRPLPQLDIEGDFGAPIRGVLSTKDQDGIMVFAPASLPNADDFSEVRSMLHRDGSDYMYVTGQEGGFRVREASSTAPPSQIPTYADYDFGFPEVLQAPSISLLISGNAESNYCRVAYCYTLIDKDGRESPPSVAGVYQSSVNVDAQFNVTIPALLDPAGMGIQYANLYRVITPFQTGDAQDNPIDAAFHMMLADITYTGYSSVTTKDELLFDIRDGRTLANVTATRFPRSSMIAVSPDGWLAVQFDEYIYISKRHQYHVLPLEHVVSVPGIIIAMAWKDSILYVGTKGRPARITVQGLGELARIDVDLYSESLPCTKKDTFVTTGFGAMYASTDGLVALTQDGAVVATQNLVDPFAWRATYAPELGTWYRGRYVGYRNSDSTGFIFDFAEITEGQHELSELVSYRFPPSSNGLGFVVDLLATPENRNSLYVASGNRLYKWDLLRTEAVSNRSLPYRWVSKVFIMPGTTQLAAAKIGMVVPGTVEFILYGDERVVYRRSLSNSTTFRLPSSYKATEYVIELQGTAFIHEVHLATSMQDLTE